MTSNELRDGEPSQSCSICVSVQIGFEISLRRALNYIRDVINYGADVSLAGAARQPATINEWSELLIRSRLIVRMLMNYLQ